MTKKGKGNAQKPADDQPQTGIAAYAPGDEAPAAEGPVAGADRDAAEAGAAQHAGEPAGADQPHAGGELIDEKTSIDAGDGSAGISDAPAQVVSAELSAAEAGTGLSCAGEAETGQTGDAGGAAGDASGTTDEEPAEVQDINHVDDPTLAPVDYVVQAAEEACAAVIYHLTEFHEFDQPQQDRLSLVSGGQHSKATNAIAELVRKIGRDRATPAVVGQQLKILHLIDDAELSAAEPLVVKVFIDTLAAIDAFDQAEAKRLEQLAAKPVEHPPMPIDETTLEPVDGPMETW